MRRVVRKRNITRRATWQRVYGAQRKAEEAACGWWNDWINLSRDSVTQTRKIRGGGDVSATLNMKRES